MKFTTLIGIALWALIPGFIAKKKDRNFWGYYFLSFLISPLITMIITLCLPKKKNSDYFEDDPNRLTECKSCGYRDKNSFNVCPKCGLQVAQYVYLNEDVISETDKIQFCRKCGEKLIDSSRFCRKCGTAIMDQPAVTITEPETCEFCKKCGAVITNDIDICHVCGEQKGNDEL